MKKRLLFPVMSIAMLAGVFNLISNVPGQKNYSPRKSNSSLAEDANGYIRWITERRANPLTGSVDIADVELARQQADAMAGGRSLSLSWEEMGPNNVGGRTRAVLVDRNDHNRLYAGGVGGGLWYSTNAGGSWLRINGGDAMNSLSVASICQGTDGYVYFGTGEGLYGNFGDGTGGFQGKGIFKSTQPSTNSYAPVDFALLPFTWQTTPTNQQTTFVHVNKMAASPTNPLRIYAATARGLRITNDGGVTWINALGALSATGKDVDVASDGTVLASVNNRAYRSATGDSGTFTILAGGLPTTGVSRIEFAIAPSNPDIMYGCAAKAADDKLLNVYMSIDKGNNWTIIGPGSTTVFSPLASQGSYDNAVGVAPNDPYKLFIAGLELWQWTLSGGWVKIDCWNCWDQSVYYTHADKHSIIFDPTNPNVMYISSDGGIAKSTNQGQTFSIKNTNYNVTQFYSVAVGPNGIAMGGTQDNGTQYITGRYSFAANGDTLLNDPQFAQHVLGGDGGFTAISYIYPPSFSPVIGTEVGAAFAATPGGALVRSNGGNWASFYDANIDFGTTTPSYNADFVTPFVLWESRNDLLTYDSVTLRVPDSLSQILYSAIPSNTTRANGTVNFNYYFQSTGDVIPGSVHITDGVHNVYDNGSGAFTGDVSAGPTNTINYVNRTFDVTFNSNLAIDSSLIVYYKVRYDINDVVNINSATISLPIAYTLPAQLISGDSVRVQDIIQTRFVAGLTAPGGNCIWMTKRSLDFSTSKPQWMKIASGLSGTPECMVFSNDGNYLFVGTNSGRVYRIAGLSHVTDSVSGWVGAGSVLTTTISATSIPGSVTGIDISESNSNKVFVTCGGYGTANHVYRSVNALSTFTFTSVQNNLPAMPAYDVVINNNDDNKIVLGTDLGIFTSDDNGATWNETNTGIARTAVVMLRQYNDAFTGGTIYAASHGRGIFKSTSLVGINDPGSSSLGSIDSRAVRVYPNPVSENGFADYVLNQSSNVNIEIYDIKGVLYKNELLGKLSSGLHRFTFDAGSMKNGTYFLVVRAGSEKATGRFVIVK